jgi:thioredoxin-related protein
MKKLILTFIFLISSISFAQDWKTNFEEAKKIATAESKNIILVFSGSDWCAPCIKLDRNIWQSEEFKKESAENWVLLKADFPKKKANLLPEEQKKANDALAEKYNREGSYPKVVILNKEGTILGILGYKNVSPTEYIAMIKTFEKK